MINYWASGVDWVAVRAEIHQKEGWKAQWEGIRNGYSVLGSPRESLVKHVSCCWNGLCQPHKKKPIASAPGQDDACLMLRYCRFHLSLIL